MCSNRMEVTTHIGATSRIIRCRLRNRQLGLSFNGRTFGSYPKDTGSTPEMPANVFTDSRKWRMAAARSAQKKTRAWASGGMEGAPLRADDNRSGCGGFINCAGSIPALPTRLLHSQ